MLRVLLGGRVRGQLHRFAWYLYGYMEMGHAQANHGGTSDTCVRNGKVDDESRLWDKVGVVVVVVFGLVLTLFSYYSWVCTAELKKRDIKDMGHEDPTHMACETFPAWPTGETSRLGVRFAKTSENKIKKENVLNRDSESSLPETTSPLLPSHHPSHPPIHLHPIPIQSTCPNHADPPNRDKIHTNPPTPDRAASLPLSRPIRPTYIFLSPWPIHLHQRAPPSATSNPRRLGFLAGSRWPLGSEAEIARRNRGIVVVLVCHKACLYIHTYSHVMEGGFWTHVLEAGYPSRTAEEYSGVGGLRGVLALTERRRPFTFWPQTNRA